MDISLDSSVVEHLTSVAGALGSIPGLAIYFHCISLYMLGVGVGNRGLVRDIVKLLS